MPTYVYKFIDSGETIEVQQSFSDPALTEAPHPADGELRPVKKVFTPVGITFRGNGFYKTDSRGSPKSSSSTSSGESGSGSSTGSGSGTESSPSSTSSSSTSNSSTTSSSSSNGSGSSSSNGNGSHSH